MGIGSCVYSVRSKIGAAPSFKGVTVIFMEKINKNNHFEKKLSFFSTIFIWILVFPKKRYHENLKKNSQRMFF
jgi:hypothetical protein